MLTIKSASGVQFLIEDISVSFKLMAMRKVLICFNLGQNSSVERISEYKRRNTLYFKYDIKLHLIMWLQFREVCCNPSLLLVPLWLGVVFFDRISSMSRIDLFKKYLYCIDGLQKLSRNNNIKNINMNI